MTQPPGFVPGWREGPGIWGELGDFGVRARRVWGRGQDLGQTVGFGENEGIWGLVGSGLRCSGQAFGGKFWDFGKMLGIWGAE